MKPAEEGLDTLASMGGFVDEEPVKQEVEWTNDEGKAFKFDVFVRQLSFGAAAEMAHSDDRELVADTLARSVLLKSKDGKLEPLAYKDAIRMKPTLGFAILGAVNKVNNPAPKNSVPPTSLSVNSSSTESAAEVSQKPENG